MGTKENPQPNDCYTKALPEEETFTLTARDAASPKAIRSWVNERIHLGKNKRNDPEIVEALACAASMEAQRKDIRRKLGKKD